MATENQQTFPLTTKVRRPYYREMAPCGWGTAEELDALSGVPVAGHDHTAARRARMRAANDKRQRRERLMDQQERVVTAADIIMGRDIAADAGWWL